jgi:hypothetical protein
MLHGMHAARAGQGSGMHARLLVLPSVLASSGRAAPGVLLAGRF